MRTKLIQVRVTEQELFIIKSRASLQGKETSTFLRDLGLGDELPPARQSSGDANARTALLFDATKVPVAAPGPFEGVKMPVGCVTGAGVPTVEMSDDEIARAAAEFAQEERERGEP